jgi:hypothetical protein
MQHHHHHYHVIVIAVTQHRILCLIHYFSHAIVLQRVYAIRFIMNDAAAMIAPGLTRCSAEE